MPAPSRLLTSVRSADHESGHSGAKNAHTNLPLVDTTVTLKCLGTPACTTMNSVHVVEHATVNTFFAKILGVKEVRRDGTVDGLLTGPGRGHAGGPPSRRASPARTTPSRSGTRSTRSRSGRARSRLDRRRQGPRQVEGPVQDKRDPDADPPKNNWTLGTGSDTVRLHARRHPRLS
jgi:hypothetical protein